MNYNDKYMKIAFDEANKAFNEGEIPIGAVIVKNDQIISKAHNMKEKMNSSLYHAEMIVLKEASLKLNNWRLDDCEIYVTLEPCPMCSSAIKQSRIKTIYSALENSDKKNHDISNLILISNDNTNSNVNIYNSLDKNKSNDLLSRFFNSRRKK